ncbi:MAG: hypothetical protein ACRD3P_01745 [Terriglobales bacterium]
MSLIMFFVVLSPFFAAASDSMAELPKKAMERSKITSPGSRPFLLKAKVLEVTNPSNENYKAEIEEHWVAPDRWRRTVRTSDFSQTLIVNGNKTSEQLTGDYYPNWLRTVVAAIFEPDGVLQGIDMSRSSDNPVIGGNQVCRRFTYMAGIAPVSNKVFSTFCFEGSLVASVGEPGYEISYKNYKGFAGKHVARTIAEYIESGTELEATIDELTELSTPDEAQFGIQQPSAPLQTLHINEATLRTLAVGIPEIVWPPIRSGADKGTLSLYVCLDRSGHVREVYELNSSNPGLSDVARDQVMKWHFKVAANHGTPVQVESILTFAFQTATANPIPVLDEEVSGKLIIRRVEPTWPLGFAPAGTPVTITLGVNENGECTGLVFITSDDINRPLVMKRLPMVLSPLRETFKQWRFQPYMQNGKPTEYQVRITFHVN